MEPFSPAAVYYYLVIVGFFTGGVATIVAIVIAYAAKSSYDTPQLEQQRKWQINTFWWSFLWGVIGIVGAFFMIGWFVLIADFIWVLYRTVKGLVGLSRNDYLYGQPFNGGRSYSHSREEPKFDGAE